MSEPTISNGVENIRRHSLEQKFQFKLGNAIYHPCLTHGTLFTLCSKPRIRRQKCRPK